MIDFAEWRIDSLDAIDFVLAATVVSSLFVLALTGTQRNTNSLRRRIRLDKRVELDLHYKIAISHLEYVGAAKNFLEAIPLGALGHDDYKTVLRRLSDDLKWLRAMVERVYATRSYRRMERVRGVCESLSERTERTMLAMRMMGLSPLEGVPDRGAVLRVVSL